MSNLLTRLGSGYIDAFEGFLKRFGTSSRIQIIVALREEFFKEFRNKEDRYLKRFLWDKFEEYKTAQEERKNKILWKEINSCAQEIMPNHIRTLYNFFAQYMNVPFVPFNLRNLTKNIIVEEKEPGAIKKLKCTSKKACVFYISNHLSNLDELVEGYFIYSYDLQTPIFIAGKNLFKGLSRIILPIFNASVLDRERIEFPRRDILRWEMQTEFMKMWAKYKMDILGFITGGRPYDGDQTKKKNVSAEFIKTLIEAVNLGYPVYIEPLSLSYTRVPEDKKLYKSFIANDHKGERTSNLFWGWVKGLQANWVLRGNPVYLTVHKPISLEEYLTETKEPRAIADKLADEIYDAVKIPTEKLLAAAAAYLYKKGEFKLADKSRFSDKKIIILDTGKVINIVDDIKNYLISNGANLEQMIDEEASAGEIVEYGLEKYKRRKSLSEKSNIGSLLVPEEEIGVFIANANHIKHKLPEYIQEILK